MLGSQDAIAVKNEVMTMPGNPAGNHTLNQMWVQSLIMVISHLSDTCIVRCGFSHWRVRGHPTLYQQNSGRRESSLWCGTCFHWVKYWTESAFINFLCKDFIFCSICFIFWNCVHSLHSDEFVMSLVAASLSVPGWIGSLLYHFSTLDVRIIVDKLTPAVFLSLCFVAPSFRFFAIP